MNIKRLKHLRKNYKYFWILDKDNDTKMNLIVTNTKKMVSKVYNSDTPIADFVNDYIADNLGFFQSHDRELVRLRRIEISNSRRALKAFESIPENKVLYIKKK